MWFRDHRRFILLSMFKRHKLLIVYSFPMIVYAVLIFVMSSLPSHSIPNLFFFSYDKLLHTIEFGLFGMLLYRSFLFHFRVKWPYVYTITAGSSYAVLDEIHQYFVFGRYCSIYDFTADFIGLVIFTAVSAYLNRYSSYQN